MFYKSLYMAASMLILLSGCNFARTPSDSKTETKSESEKLNAFLDEEFEKSVARHPTWQTYLGRKTNYGQLDNETEEYAKEGLELDKKALKALLKFNYDKLDESEKLSYRLFKHGLEESIEAYRWRYHSFPLNQMFGYQSETPSFLINMHRVDSKEDAQAYVSRIKEIKRVFDERMVFLKRQEKKGIFPPNFVFQKVVNDSKNIVSGRPFEKDAKADSPLLEDFKGKVAKLKLPAKEEKKLLDAANKALLESAKPAYKELVAYMGQLEKKAPNNHGAWALPQGKAYYKFKLRKITTTDLSAEQIHKTGLEEVARIHAEMKGIMKQVGFKGSLQDFFKRMQSKEFQYPNTKDGKAAYLRDTKKIIAQMEKSLPKLFNTFPKAKLEVKAVEPFREQSAGMAFYSSPSLEGNRPGIYYVNLYNMEDVPKYEMEALAYHEAVPGHHMQLAIAKELEELPKFRRTSGFTAYSEGWGLYSELLPKEIGFYQDPYSDFGRLSMELWRAARLVVDTGIHAKKWSREKAIEYLKQNTPAPEGEAVKGIERYFVMPGQATAYKVGMLKILELRQRAKTALGEKFSLPEFHDVILRDGGLPLFILEEQVDAWIEKKKQ